MATRALAGCLLLWLAFGAQAIAESAAPPPTLTVVVHPETGIGSISRAELSKIFLKRLRTWKNGRSARPVDQSPESDVRREFSRRVHRRDVVTIELYWKRMIFSGNAVPPPELESDERVLEFVRLTPGAVGYVGRSADLDGVRTLILEQ